MTLTPLAVPNTLLVGQNVGTTFQVSAIDVNGAITLGANGTSNVDYYAFTATAGQLFNFEALSQTITRDNGDDIDPVLTLLESDGQTIVPYGSFVERHVRPVRERRAGDRRRLVPGPGLDPLRRDHALHRHVLPPGQDLRPD